MTVLHNLGFFGISELVGCIVLSVYSVPFFIHLIRLLWYWNISETDRFAFAKKMLVVFCVVFEFNFFSIMIVYFLYGNPIWGLVAGFGMMIMNILPVRIIAVPEKFEQPKWFLKKIVAPSMTLCLIVRLFYNTPG